MFDYFEFIYYVIAIILLIAIPSPLPKVKKFIVSLNLFVSKSKREMQEVKKDLEDIKKGFKSLQKALNQ